MKQQDISQQLGSLISQTTGNGQYGMINPDESIPTELEQPAPIFEVDHQSERQKAQKTAYEAIEFIVKSVVPKQYQDHEMIRNKMKLDMRQLGNLYYMQDMNFVNYEAAMGDIAKGDTSPRKFDIIDKLEKRASDLSDQITNLENQFRKYYIDSYLDLDTKERMEADDPMMLAAPEESKSKKLENKKEGKQNEDGSVIITDATSLVREMQLAKQKMVEEAEEADFQEV